MGNGKTSCGITRTTMTTIWLYHIYNHDGMPHPAAAGKGNPGWSQWHMTWREGWDKVQSTRSPQEYSNLQFRKRLAWWWALEGHFPIVLYISTKSWDRSFERRIIIISIWGFIFCRSSVKINSNAKISRFS